MAKRLSARVSKTSGQGISRLAYQQAYRMKGGLTEKFTAGSSQSRDYSKKGAKLGGSDPIVADYGDTIEPGNLGDVQALGEGSPPPSWKDRRTPSKLKVPK